MNDVVDVRMPHERYPDKVERASSTPIQEMVNRAEPERIEIVRKRIVYEYKPLYILAFTICFGMLLWASAFTIVQLSDNMTARACFTAGGSWQIGDEGIGECTGVTTLAPK